MCIRAVNRINLLRLIGVSMNENEIAEVRGQPRFNQEILIVMPITAIITGCIWGPAAAAITTCINIVSIYGYIVYYALMYDRNIRCSTALYHSMYCLTFMINGWFNWGMRGAVVSIVVFVFFNFDDWSSLCVIAKRKPLSSVTAKKKKSKNLARETFSARLPWVR